MSKVKAQVKTKEEKKEKAEKSWQVVDDSALKATLTNLSTDFNIKMQPNDDLVLIAKGNVVLDFNSLLTFAKSDYSIKEIENRWRTVHVTFEKVKK